MAPFIPALFGQRARYGCLITHFLPFRLSVSVSDSRERTLGGRKEGRGGEKEERKGRIDYGGFHSKREGGKC